MFKKIKELLGIPFNPYKNVKVAVQGNRLVEYVPGPHVIVDSLPYEFPAMCVEIVKMPGHRLKGGSKEKNIFVLLFYCAKHIYYYPVLITMKNKRLSFETVHCKEKLIELLGKKGFNYLKDNSRISFDGIIIS